MALWKRLPLLPTERRAPDDKFNALIAGLEPSSIAYGIDVESRPIQHEETRDPAQLHNGLEALCSPKVSPWPMHGGRWE